MYRLAPGVAHVSFAGGGMFLPVHGPYDLQLLVEHVTESTRSRGLVQLLIGAAHWMVRLQSAGPAVRCSGCERWVGAVACTPAQGGDARCLVCATSAAVPAATAPLVRRAAGMR